MQSAPRYSAAVAVALSTFIGGCTTQEPEALPNTWGPVRTYTGSYLAGWELSDFTPVDHTEKWWLSGNLKFNYPNEAPPGTDLFITVEGRLSPPGHYGNLGGFRHELRVTRVISAMWLPKAPNKTMQRTPTRRSPDISHD